jgi:hypothetical protein
VDRGLYPAIEHRRDAIKLARRITVLMREVMLVAGSLFIIQLIQTFEQFSTHQSRHKIWLIAGHSDEHIDFEVYRRNKIGVDLPLLFFLLGSGLLENDMVNSKKKEWQYPEASMRFQGHFSVRFLAVGFAFSAIYDAVKTLRKTHNQNKGKY